jgi:rhodanese-related sulfurtransferase
VEQISPLEVASIIEKDSSLILLDIREEVEYRISCVKGSMFFPMSLLFSYYFLLDPKRSYFVLCHHGVRSARVVNFLVDKGFVDVYNIVGGIDAWAREVDFNVVCY